MENQNKDPQSLFIAADKKTLRILVLVFHNPLSINEERLSSDAKSRKPIKQPTSGLKSLRENSFFEGTAFVGCGKARTLQRTFSQLRRLQTPNPQLCS
jgi:hypothetical protein